MRSCACFDVGLWRRLEGVVAGARATPTGLITADACNQAMVAEWEIARQVDFRRKTTVASCHCATQDAGACTERQDDHDFQPGCVATR